MLGMGLTGLKYLVKVIGFYFLCIGIRHVPLIPEVCVYYLPALEGTVALDGFKPKL